MSGPNKNYDPVEVTPLHADELERTRDEALKAFESATDLNKTVTPPLSLAKGEATRTPAASRCTQSFKLTIDLLLFSAKHRKCFCLLDVSAASGLHCSCWV